MGRSGCASWSLGIGTSTSAGELIFTIVAAVGQMERDLIAERTKSALDVKHRRGERIWGSQALTHPRAGRSGNGVPRYDGHDRQRGRQSRRDE
ncbi:recombinase family protein [Brevibacterium sp. RIT803]|nr:recombinase family protein [Brevibacterium sp. RIT 803]